jgi:hypothetical protein
MARDEDRGEEGRDGAPPGGGAGEPEDEESGQRITLDRYASRRRRLSYVSWAHLSALAFMLATLVLLVLYKDRCGQAVSSFVFIGADSGPPAARIQLDPKKLSVPQEGKDRGH